MDDLIGWLTIILIQYRRKLNNLNTNSVRLCKFEIDIVVVTHINMYSKGLRSVLLFLALGFLVIWFLEFRRTTLAESYWALLVVLLCLLWVQLINVKLSSSRAGEKAGPPPSSKSRPNSKKKKR